MAVGTTPDPMGHNLIRYLDLAQGMSLVSWLPSGLFAALLAQRFPTEGQAIR